MGIMKCTFSLVTTVVTVQRLEKISALILPHANCEIPVWSDDGAGNSLKAEPIFTTKFVVAEAFPSDATTDGKCATSSFAEPALHNFGTICSIPKLSRSLPHEIIFRWQENVSTTTRR